MIRIVLAGALALTANAAPLRLARLPVVLPAGAGPVSRFAAEELARYLEKITGERPAIRGGDAPASAILIRADAGEEAIALRREGDRVILAGAGRSGPLFAVYAFLERLGCRWPAPNYSYYAPASGDYVPVNPGAAIDALDVRERPAFRWRKKYVEEGRSHNTENLLQMIDWMAKTRLNVLNCPIDYQHTGRARWDNWREALIPELRKRGMYIEVGGHGYPNFLPQDRYFDQHPEWFGTVKGQRSRAANLVFSTSNQDAVRTFLANIKEYLRAHPEIDIFDCWPPDGARWSDAPADTALGAPAERHMLLMQRVAGELAADFPNLKVQFIAYASYLDPPAGTRPPANLVMDFCPINRSFTSRLFDPHSEQNVKYFQSLKAWLERMDPASVSLYTYITKYAWRSLPVLIPRMIADETRRYREMGIGGFSTYSEPASWAAFELDHYIAARYNWDTTLDLETELAGYAAARYGPAAAPVLKYLRLVEDTVRFAIGIPGTELDLARQRDLVAGFTPAAKLLETARAKAGGDPALLTLLDKLEGSRRYAENEMRLRLEFLQSARGAGRGEFERIPRLLEERRAIVEEYGAKGVILRGASVR